MDHEDSLSIEQPVVITPAVSDEEIAAVLAEEDEKLEAIEAARSTWVASEEEESVDEATDEASTQSEPVENSDSITVGVTAVAKEPAELV